MSITGYSFTPAQLADNGYSTVLDNWYEQSSAFARAVFTTDATSMIVETFCTLYGTSPTYASVGVRVDGADVATGACVRPGVNGALVSLPAGSKTVEVIAGLQSKSGTLVTGTYLRRIWLDSAASFARVAPSVTNRLLIYGDSIAVGQAASSPALNSWGALLRALRGNVAFEAWGTRSLNDDCVDATARGAFVTRLASYTPSTIWLAIGTNDYGLNKWTAASFGTAYAALLDDLHTALPSATIYCQTPITRTTETANAGGSTLGNYRTQIATAQSTRSGYATLVDGSAILTSLDLADGIHPTTAGHAKYYAAVKTVLGL